MKLTRLIIPITFSMLLSACGNGITDTVEAAAAPVPVQDDDVDGDPGLPVGDGAYVSFESLDFSYGDNSVVEALFRTRDQHNEPLDSLSLSDFDVLEDAQALNSAESLLGFVPVSSLPYELQTAIVLDVSASTDAQELAQMTRAISEFIASSERNINSLISRQRVAIYTADSAVRRVVSFTGDQQVLELALDSVQVSAASSTDLYGAVQRAANDIDERYLSNSIVEGAIILITDGKDNADRVTAAQAMAASRGLAVFVIAVGEGTDTTDLQGIATEGLESVPDYYSVIRGVQAVQSRLLRWLGSVYKLNYASPKRRAEGAASNSDHSFELRAVDNSNSNADTARLLHTFNASRFGEVRAVVSITGPQSITVGQTESYIAETRWGGQVGSIYSWSISGQGCVLMASFQATARVTAVQQGNCQLLAVDTAHSAATTLSVDAQSTRLEP